VETWQSVSDEAKDFVSKILVGDPKKRINFDEMMAHPWMTITLEPKNKLSLAKSQLSKYVSIRKEKS